jgi:uncharacterized repeat protein (TIGR03803 family)
MSFVKFSPPLVLALLWIVTIPSAWAQTYKVLYSFTGGTDGAFPLAGVIRDSAGNLYGTSSGEQNGTVFKVNPKGKFKLLYALPVPQGEGSGSPPSALLRDSSGNLYGTIPYSGANHDGMVYKIDKNDNFTALYNFTSGWNDGENLPLGPLILDAAGDLYGAGPGGGECQSGPCGTIFKLAPSGGETQIRSFLDGARGFYPNAGLIRDAAGNLYGTTESGGKGHHGVVFKLDQSGNETILYTFKGSPDGSGPRAGLIRDSAGNFYGTTLSGGNRGCPDLNGPLTCGVVFKLDTNGNETVLYAFTGGADGGNPSGPLVMDAAGNLYGAAGWGNPGYGVVFKLTTSGKEIVLHSFAGGTNGAGPTGTLAMDSAGNLYGVTNTGGDLSGCTTSGPYGCGVIFTITP